MTQPIAPYDRHAATVVVTLIGLLVLFAGVGPATGCGSSESDADGDASATGNNQPVRGEDARGPGGGEPASGVDQERLLPEVKAALVRWDAIGSPEEEQAARGVYVLEMADAFVQIARLGGEPAMAEVRARVDAQLAARPGDPVLLALLAYVYADVTDGASVRLATERFSNARRASQAPFAVAHMLTGEVLLQYAVLLQRVGGFRDQDTIRRAGQAFNAALDIEPAQAIEDRARRGAIQAWTLINPCLAVDHARYWVSAAPAEIERWRAYLRLLDACGLTRVEEARDRALPSVVIADDARRAEIEALVNAAIEGRAGEVPLPDDPGSEHVDPAGQPPPREEPGEG